MKLIDSEYIKSVWNFLSNTTTVIIMLPVVVLAFIGMGLYWGIKLPFWLLKRRKVGKKRK
jgi:hypothetical protein